MLVVEPGKRITLAQIRQHRWMQAHPCPPPACPALGYSSNLGDYDEQVLGVMQTLGVDRQRTVEVSARPPGPGLGGSGFPGGRRSPVRLKWGHGLI